MPEIKPRENRTFIGPVYIKNKPEKLTNEEYDLIVNTIEPNSGTADYAELSKDPKYQSDKKSIYDIDVEVEKLRLEAKTNEFISSLVKPLLNEDSNTGEKYRKWFYGYNNPDTNWCTMFVNWYFNHDKESKLYVMPSKDSGLAGEGIEASIKAGYGKWYEDENTDSKTVPRVGDVITFTWNYENGKGKGYKFQTPYGSDHVGIVYKVDDNKVYTIEGNASSDDASTSTVICREYDRKDPNINGYYRPNYETKVK